jgi:hypothetical protein
MSMPIRPSAPEETAETEPRNLGPWRVRPVLPVLKAVGALLFVAAAVLSRSDPVGLTIGVAAALVLAALTLRDLIAAVRLAADPDGVTVATWYAGHHRLAWADIERVSVDRRSRLGIRTELVEIDAGDAIYQFSRSELGAPPDEVVDALAALRTGVSR